MVSEVQQRETFEMTDNGDQTYNSQSSVIQRVSIAGGFLDFALFVADVEHLKFIVDTGKDDIKYYTLLFVLLIISLSLQLIVGILIFIVGFSTNSRQTYGEAKWTQIINHFIIGLVSLIAIVNVLVTTFGDRNLLG